jgi:hypothetical protein
VVLGWGRAARLPVHRIEQRAALVLALVLVLVSGGGAKCRRWLLL